MVEISADSDSLIVAGQGSGLARGKAEEMTIRLLASLEDNLRRWIWQSRAKDWG